MKSLSAIVFSALLTWMQIVPASAVCAKAATTDCAAPGKSMDCCAGCHSMGSKSAPAVPARSNSQNQISAFSFLASAQAIWTLPENKSASNFSSATSPLTAAGAPLYARHCALLL